MMKLFSSVLPSVLSTVIVGILLASCVSTSPTPASTSVSSPVAKDGVAGDLKVTYQHLAEVDGKTFVLDPAASAVRIYAFRSGRAAKLGHNHVLAAPQFNGFFYLPSSGTSNARFDLEFRLDQLEIDNPAYRASLGNAFAAVLSPEAIEGTRQHMLGPDGLQADQFPYVRIHSLSISGESPKFAANVQVEIHGQTREMWIPLNVEGLPDKLSVAGSFVLRQSDFGAQPYSVMNGLLSIQDEIVVEFQLRGG
jgi:hypothetical protein